MAYARASPYRRTVANRLTGPGKDVPKHPRSVSSQMRFETHRGAAMSRKSKIKVPKRVAGVKIPKVVRKGPVLDFVNSSAARMLLAEALTAAVGMFAYRKTADGTGDGIKQTAMDAEETLKQNTTRLTFAFGEAV